MVAATSPKVGKARKRAGNCGLGRKKGIPNKNTTLLKDMILGALDAAGGMKYLAKQAIENPSAFMQLVGKVLPLQLTGEGGGPIITQSVGDADLARLITFQLTRGAMAAAANDTESEPIKKPRAARA